MQIEKNKNNKTIAVIGANGYIGSHLCNEILKRKFSLIKVIRGDNISEKIKNAEYVIHSANSGKRFFANSNPEKDFHETVIKTKQINELILKGKKKLILISSISARTQLNTFYGINRRSAEILVNRSNSLVLRIGPIFGGSKTGGPLLDIINSKKVFVSSSTKSAYANIEYYCKKIIDLKDEYGVFELGAKDFIILENFMKHCNSMSTFSGDDDTQIPEDCFDDAPSVKEAYKFFKIKYQ